MDSSNDWVVDHPFQFVVGSGAAVFVAGVLNGMWLRPLLVSILVVVTLGISVLADRAAFRRGGMEQLRRQRRREFVCLMIGLAVLIAVVVVPVLA